MVCEEKEVTEKEAIITVIDSNGATSELSFIPAGQSVFVTVSFVHTETVTTIYAESDTQVEYRVEAQREDGTLYSSSGLLVGPVRSILFLHKILLAMTT